MPQEVKHILCIFAETRVLVEEPRFDVLTGRYFLPRGWNSPNFPVGKSTGKHITSKCCCLLLIGSSVMHKSVLLYVRPHGELAIKIPNGVCLKSIYFIRGHLFEHFSGYIVGHLYNVLCGPSSIDFSRTAGLPDSRFIVSCLEAVEGKTWCLCRPGGNCIWVLYQCNYLASQ